MMTFSADDNGDHVTFRETTPIGGFQKTTCTSASKWWGGGTKSVSAFLQHGLWKSTMPWPMSGCVLTEKHGKQPD